MSTRAEWAIALACCALAGACQADPDTGIVLEVRTDLRVPIELDKLTLNVRSHGTFLLGRSYPLGDEPGKWTLPSSVALTPAGPHDGVVSIEAVGHLGSLVMVARSMIIPFVPGQVHRTGLELARECLTVVCVEGKTCVPGAGCQPVDAPPTQPPARGPACDCQSFFPMCVGSTWTFEEVNFSTNLPTTKTYVVQDHARIKDSSHDKDGKPAFVQFRTIDGGVLRRWISLEGEPGRRQLYYEMDDTFDSEWHATLSTYFVPARLRFDETRTRVGDTWLTDHDQYLYRMGPMGLVTADPVVKMRDRWIVIDAPDDLGAPLRARFSDKEILCHKRFATRAGEPAPKEETYCFARGVGKIYDATFGGDVERLISHDVPGCGRSSR